MRNDPFGFSDKYPPCVCEFSKLMAVFENLKAEPTL
jgi:hypothetical protein